MQWALLFPGLFRFHLRTARRVSRRSKAAVRSRMGLLRGSTFLDVVVS